MSIRFVPIAGVREIGRNCYLFYCSKTKNAVLVDLGVKFGEINVDNAFDSLLPDLKIIRDLSLVLKYIIITHCHEDHIGGFKYFDVLTKDIKEHFCPNIKILTTPFNMMMLEKKYKVPIPKEVLPCDQEVFVDQSFSFRILSISHSIPSAVAVFFKCGNETILHTGDWKIEEEPVIEENYFPALAKRVKELSGGKLTAVIGDSTNSITDINVRPKTERQAYCTLLTAMKSDRYRNKCFFITCFASSASTIVTVLRCAKEVGRKVVVQSTSMRALLDICEKNKIITKDDLSNMISPKEALTLARNKLAYVISGTQGERTSTLAKVAKNSVNEIKLGPDSVVVFACRVIPGNEVNVQNLMSNIASNGAEIAFDFAIHITGHAYASLYDHFYKTLKPANVIPVHGNLFQMDRHARIAKEAGVPHTLLVESGSIVEFEDNVAKCVAAHPIVLNGVMKDTVMPVNSLVAEHRRILINSGVMVVSIDRKTAKVVGTQLIGAFIREEIVGSLVSVTNAKLAVSADAKTKRTARRGQDVGAASYYVKFILDNLRTMTKCKPFIVVKFVA